MSVKPVKLKPGAEGPSKSANLSPLRVNHARSQEGPGPSMRIRKLESSKQNHTPEKWTGHLHSILRYRPVLGAKGPLKSGLKQKAPLDIDGSFSIIKDTTEEGDEHHLPRLLRPESRIFRKESLKQNSLTNQNKKQAWDSLLPESIELNDLGGPDWQALDRREYELQQLAFICWRGKKLLEAKKRVASKKRKRARRSDQEENKDYVVSDIPPRRTNMNSSAELLSKLNSSASQLDTPQNSVNERSSSKSRVLRSLRSARESFLDFKMRAELTAEQNTSNIDPRKWNESFEDDTIDLSEENNVIMEMYHKDAQDKQIKLMKRRLEILQLTKKPRVPPASDARDPRVKEKELPLLQELKNADSRVRRNDEGLTMKQRMNNHRQYLGSLRRLVEDYRAHEPEIKPEVQLKMDELSRKRKKPTNQRAPAVY